VSGDGKDLPAAAALVTSPVAVGEVTFELPCEWTPVIDVDGYVDRALTDAWAAYTAWMPETDGRATWFIQQRWFLLLFRLWHEDVLELAEHALKPGAPLEPIDIYPPSLRHPENFGMPTEGLVHLRSGRVHYAPCYRLRPLPPARPAASAAHMLPPEAPQAAPEPTVLAVVPDGDAVLPPATPTPAGLIKTYLARPGRHSKRGLLRARDEAGLRGTPGFGNENLLLWWPDDAGTNRGGAGSKG
jgi:hypothetical protein